MKKRLGDSGHNVIAEGSCPYRQSRVAPDDLTAAGSESSCGERACPSAADLPSICMARDGYGDLDHTGIDPRIVQRIDTLGGRQWESQQQGWLPRTGSFHTDMHCKERQLDDKSEYVVRLETSDRGSPGYRDRERSGRRPPMADEHKAGVPVMRADKFEFEEVYHRMHRMRREALSSRQDRERRGRGSRERCREATASDTRDPRTPRFGGASTGRDEHQHRRRSQDPRPQSRTERQGKVKPRKPDSRR